MVATPEHERLYNMMFTTDSAERMHLQNIATYKKQQQQQIK